MEGKKQSEILRPDFLMIPGPVAFSSELQPLDKNVYGVVYWLHSLKDGECRASNLYLGKVCGATPRSVQKSLERLEHCGFIQRGYRDGAKKMRDVIVPLVEYNVRPNGRTGTSKRTYEVRPNGRQIRKNDKEERIDIAPTSGAPSDEEKKSDTGTKKTCSYEGCSSEPYRERETCPAHTPMSCEQFVEWCRGSSSEHVKIIGEWADEVRPSLKTLAQWNEFLARNLRPAKRLTPFSSDQISDAMERIERNQKAGWLTEFTLETVLKYVTEPEK